MAGCGSDDDRSSEKESAAKAEDVSSSESDTPSAEEAGETEEAPKSYSSAAEWIADRYGTFDTFKTSGTGPQEVKLPQPIKAGIATIVVHDQSTTVLDPLGPGGPDDEGLPFASWSEEGEDPYTGINIWLPTDDELPHTQIVGTEIPHSDDVSWELTIQPLTALPKFKNSGKAGNRAYIYEGPEASCSFTAGGRLLEVQEITAHGDGIPTWVWSKRMPDESSKKISAGPSIITISASEDWAATVE